LARRLPRAAFIGCRACSRSIASNSALKFPLPKPCDPVPFDQLKNTVGRSYTGWVKICSR
jgi:hypothetical protein